MSIFLIRHGKTEGNLQHRYIGKRTDEPLCEAGREELLKKQYPEVKRVFSSPMKRCVETAGLIAPGTPVETVAEFAECDFGEFENKNYEELNGRQDYQRWLDSGGELPFPGGESRREFALRCTAAFERLMENIPWEGTMFTVHGGTIMAIMEAFARPQGNYFDFQVKNGEGYWLEKDGRYGKI